MYTLGFVVVVAVVVWGGGGEAEAVAGVLCSRTFFLKTGV